MIIGLTGKAGSGKDTVADYLVENHNFIKLSWARPLKQALEVMGFPEPENRDDKEKLIPGFDFTWRQAAQTLGTEWGRALDRDIWIKIVGQRLRAAPNANWVLADCRFENEGALVRSLGGSVWHVQGRAADLGANAGHASEAGIAFSAASDAILGNAGSMANLYSQIDDQLGAWP